MSEEVYKEGYWDGYDGNYANPYDKDQETDKWLAYRVGFELGEEQFFAEESTPLSEQVTLAEQDAAA